MRSLIPVLLVLHVGCGEDDPFTDTITQSADTGTYASATTDSKPYLPTTGTRPTDEERVLIRDALVHPAAGSILQVRWEQAGAEVVRVEYMVDDGEWLSTPPIAGEPGLNDTLVVGVPYSVNGPREVPWAVVTEDGQRFEASEPFVPGPLPSGVPRPQVTVSTPSEWGTGGDYLLTTINQEEGGWTGGTYWVVIYDRRGRPVWVNRVPNRHWSLSARLSRSGTFLLWDEATLWSDGDDGDGSMVHRSYLDRPIDMTHTPGLHRGFVELPGGGLAWGSQSPRHGATESIVERVEGRPDHVVWRCDGWSALQQLEGGCESSNLFFYAQRGTYVISFYSHDLVAEIDGTTGQLLWHAGEVAGGYGTFPYGSDFERTHSASFTDGGSLIVTTERAIDPEASTRTTAVREYKLQHGVSQLQQERVVEGGRYASIGARALRLDSGNTLMMFGSAGEVLEVNRAGVPVWGLDFEGSRLLGRGEFLPDLYALVSPAQ